MISEQSGYGRLPRAGPGDLFRRARVLLNRRGVIGTTTHLSQAVWNRVFNHQQLVYELPCHLAVQFHAIALDSVRVEVYRSLDQMPAASISSLAVEHGSQLVPLLEDGFRGGATLFVVEYHGVPASILWAKPGALAKRWYVPLSSSDVVLYGWHTSPEHRGRNLIGHAMQSAIAYFSPAAKRFLADVRIWNTPSIRAMEKAGFRIVARAKPLS